MDTVNIDLQHCYGIKALRKTLDFKKARAYALYAPNGVMKSSLAQTFQDAASLTGSQDRIFPARKTSRKITDENGADIEGERVLVVLPYDSEFGPTEKTSTLLVDAKLRKEYEQIHQAIDETKGAFLKAVRTQAGSKKNFEAEIAAAFTNDGDFDVAVTRIRSELERQKDAPFSTVRYDVIFEDKVLKALDTKDLKTAIDEYIRRYNELLAASTYFKKGTFDYFNAGQIAKSLADNGFFDAKHTVYLKANGENLEINTQKELEAVIAAEKDAIIKDKDLRKNFDIVQKQLDKNAELREFYRYLQNNESLLSCMGNVNKFREDVIKSYIKENFDLYIEMMRAYDAAAQRIKEIEEEARKQRTSWEEVIAIFNERFFVPFQLEAKNRIEVMLGDSSIINLGFTYIDGKESVPVEKTNLMKVLSTGERKALYILNVIFEIQRRTSANIETLVVVDDIADSFDYQNKYAIIQYLKDISDEGLFKLIIMTHNFDFFRTIESRFVGYSHCLMASKTTSGVSLTQATGIRNVFARDWRENFFIDAKKKIASIAFVRNLIEMTTGESDPNFSRLTSMLHWREDSNAIKVGDLDEIFCSVCNVEGSSSEKDQSIYEFISKHAEECLTGGNSLNLEIKVVLAIAIRLAAERFMVEKINDDDLLATITSNQTNVLLRRYRRDFRTDRPGLRILDRVALITPENIHLNSFMYEPILDMSDLHLKKLYQDVARLA